MELRLGLGSGLRARNVPDPDHGQPLARVNRQVGSGIRVPLLDLPVQIHRVIMMKREKSIADIRARERKIPKRLLFRAVDHAGTIRRQPFVAAGEIFHPVRPAGGGSDLVLHNDVREELIRRVGVVEGVADEGVVLAARCALHVGVGVAEGEHVAGGGPGGGAKGLGVGSG